MCVLCFLLQVVAGTGGTVELDKVEKQAKRGHDLWTVMNSVLSGRVKISMTLHSTIALDTICTPKADHPSHLECTLLG